MTLATSLATSRLPSRTALATLPTPLTNAPALARALGTGPLCIKRDDLTGFGFAGAKARKLEFFLAAARHAGADVLLSGGAPGSNFAAATAAAAGALQLECHLLIAAAAPRRGQRWHPNLAAAHAWGAQLHWTNTERRTSVDEALPGLQAQLTAAGHHPYTLPRGGATGLGALGGVTAALELATQQRGHDHPPEHLVIATGSGGTLAGLLVGNALLQHPWRITGVSVSRPVDELASRVLALAGECAAHLGLDPVGADELHLIDAREPDRDRASPAGRVAARQALSTTGLVLDPVYTAKTLAALPAAVAQTSAPTVFWHTGGLLGAVDEWLQEHTP